MVDMKTETVSFKRSHDILIKAPPPSIFDYVTNPNSWPEWLVASHHIESPNRPLVKGDTFRELWHTRKGEAELNWIITTCEHPRVWIGETGTPFIGPIIVRYDCVEVSTETRYTRTLINPARPKPPSDEMLQRIDDEAAIGLSNIKRIVEARWGNAD